MVGGSIHPNGTNFRRIARLDVVARVRRLCETHVLEKRPTWLEWCERVPPLENHNLHYQARKIRNPYPQMVNHLLSKYPDLRFQDCYVDGNDWSRGNDSYRDDHPVMQFVARQLQFMRTEGLSKKEAFERTEELFRERREWLEQNQKVMMAMALEQGLQPMFTTGSAYLQAEMARAEEAHLKIIREQLRRKREAAKGDATADKDKAKQRREAELKGAKSREKSRRDHEVMVTATQISKLQASFSAEDSALFDELSETVVDFGEKVRGQSFRDVLMNRSNSNYSQWVMQTKPDESSKLHLLFCYLEIAMGTRPPSELKKLLNKQTTQDSPEQGSSAGASPGEEPASAEALLFEEEKTRQHDETSLRSQEEPTDTAGEKSFESKSLLNNEAKQALDDSFSVQKAGATPNIRSGRGVEKMFKGKQPHKAALDGEGAEDGLSEDAREKLAEKQKNR